MNRTEKTTTQITHTPKPNLIDLETILTTEEQDKIIYTIIFILLIILFINTYLW